MCVFGECRGFVFVSSFVEVAKLFGFEFFFFFFPNPYWEMGKGLGNMSGQNLTAN